MLPCHQDLINVISNMPSIHKLLQIGYFWKMALRSTAEAHCSLNIYFISTEEYLTFRNIIFSTLGDFILHYYQHWKNSLLACLLYVVIKVIFTYEHLYVYPSEDELG